jgi:hypothetical protein
MHIRSYCISGVSGILCRSFTYNHGWTRSIGGWRIFPVGLAVLLGIPVYIPHLWVY